ncbi:MAG: aldo/keto reductase [Chitinophagia bacterium]|jgi:aryl-alcohol dehydrogenase-like predicted oxidoreductase
MKYRTLGNSQIQASCITFGAWAIGGWMWGGADQKEALKAIIAGWELGVTSIDTAPIYGQGLSEQIVGEALKSIPRDQVQIFTKCGLRWDLAKGQFNLHSSDNTGKEIDIYRYAGKESILEECENSLRRLGTDYIDLYQLHWPDPTTPIEESMEALLQLKQQGKVREVGVCNYSAEQIEIAEKVIQLATAQNPYSMLNRDIEKTLVPYCISHQKGVMAYSPMQRGLLTGKIKPNHVFAEGDTRNGNRFFSPYNIKETGEFLEKIQPIADAHGITLGQLALAWTLHQPGISIALAGARTAAQCKENAYAAEVQLQDEELQYIENRLSEMQLIFS